MITALCYATILVFSINAQAFPSILTRIEGSIFQQGLLLSSLYLLFPLSSGSAGYIADRIGKRPVLMLGAVAMGVPFVIAAFTAGIWTWIAAVLLFGIGSGILEGQASALLSDANPGRERAVLNASQFFYSVGATGGPFLIVALFNFSPGAALSVPLLAAGVISLFLFLWITFTRGEHATSPSLEPASLRTLYRDRVWRLLCISLFLYVAVEMGTVSWLAMYSHEILGVTEAMAPISIGLFWAGLGLSRAAIGFLKIKAHDRTILLAATATGLVFHCAAFLAKSATVAFVLFFILGFCWGSIWPTLVAAAGKRFKNSTGAAVGIMVASGAMAIPIVQPIIGALSSEGALGMRGTLLALAVLIVANLVVIRRAVAT